MKREEQVRILLVDDHTLFRQGIRSCLGPCRRFRVVGEAANGTEAVRQARKLQPSVVLMDISMPVMNGLEATNRIRRDCPGTRVLMLTVHNSREFVEPMIAAGANGCVLKDASLEELVEAIEAVHGQRLFFSPEVTRFLIEKQRGSSGRAARPSVLALSEREKEVLRLMVQGQSSKEIAAALQVGVRTVQTYRERLMKKLGIHHVAGLTKYVMESGMGLLLESNGPGAGRP